MSEDKKANIKRGDDTMAALTKPVNHAFVLNAQKADTFLAQDNKQFKTAMARFHKFKKQDSHSIDKK